MKPYDIVAELENQIAKYIGAKYCIAVDSCTNALLLCMDYIGIKGRTVNLPKKTYVGVAQSVLNSGGKCNFYDFDWRGNYSITIQGKSDIIIDSARWFSSGIYQHNTLMCFSAHWGKTLKIGRGGFIVTDNYLAAEALKIMRFDGRAAGVPPLADNFNMRGRHCYMLPEEAARGLMLMSTIPKNNVPLPEDGYADLSQFPLFQELV